MKIIKRLAAVLAVVAMAIPNLAAEGGVKLNIHFKNGEIMELDFADRPTVSFNSKNALKIQSSAMSMKVKAFSTVDKITFDDQSGIADAVSNGKTIAAESGNKVALIGFKAGTKVDVVGVNGVAYISTTVDSETRFELSLDKLEKGVYVVTAESEMCKLIIN